MREYTNVAIKTSSCNAVLKLLSLFGGIYLFELTAIILKCTEHKHRTRVVCMHFCSHSYGPWNICMYVCFVM